jgi:hypothetical protein
MAQPDNAQLAAILDEARAFDSELLAAIGYGETEYRALLDEIGKSGADGAPPDVDFKEYDESAADDVEYITCPECGHRWPK